MPKFRNKLTGEIYEVDDNGNILQTIRPEIGTGFTGVAPTTSEDIFRESPFGAKLLRGAMVSGGGALGLLGGPAGVPTGAAFGDLTYRQLQNLFPRALGARGTTGGELLETGVNVGTELLGTGAAKVLSPLASKIAQRLHEMRAVGPKTTLTGQLFPTRAIPEFTEAIEQSDIPVDVSQVTQNRFARAVRDILHPSETEKLFEIQQRGLEETAEKLATRQAGTPIKITQEPTYELATKAHGKAATERAALRQTEHTLWEEFENVHPQLHKVIVLDPKKELMTYDWKGNPIYKDILIPRTIEGPIYLTQTQPWAAEIVKSLDSEIAANIGVPGTANRLTTIRDLLIPFANAPKDSVTGRSVIPIKGLKEVYSGTLDDLIQQLPDTTPEIKARLRGVAPALRSKLSTDRIMSIQEWGDDATEAAQNAFEATKKMAMRFDNDLARDLVNRYNDPNIIYEKLFDKALGSTQQSKQWHQATGDKQEIAGELLYRIFNKGRTFDVEEQLFKYKPEALFTVMKSYGGIIDEVLGETGKRNLETLVNLSAAINPEKQAAGRVAFMIRAGGAALSVMSGTLTGLKTGNLPAGVTTGGTALAIIEFSRRNLRKLIFDPENARRLIRLSQLPVTSPEATLLTKAIFTTLKGTQITLQTQTGLPLGTGRIKDSSTIEVSP